MAGDVDVVTVGATRIHGRADFEIWHMRLLSGRFKESTNTPSETFVRFIRPDFAVIDGSWFIQSDKNAAGSARTKRFGLMSMLAEKRKGSWLVVVAQNTNRGARPPQLDDIKRPIIAPRPDSNPSRCVGFPTDVTAVWLTVLSDSF